MSEQYGLEPMAVKKKDSFLAVESICVLLIICSLSVSKKPRFHALNILSKRSINSAQCQCE